MYFLNEVVTKIVQRNFQCKHTAIFITLTSLSIPECLQRATRSQWNSIFRERSIITPWNNSWILTNSLETISLSVFQLLPKLIPILYIECHSSGIKFFVYYTLPFHPSAESVLYYLRYPGTYVQITEELWWTSLT